MHEIENRPLYRWTEYALEQKRINDEHRHARAAFLGALTALGCAFGILYMLG
jgi:hypothetical protein